MPPCLEAKARRGGLKRRENKKKARRRRGKSHHRSCLPILYIYDTITQNIKGERLVPSIIRFFARRCGV
jgi:hypothetical protein